MSISAAQCRAARALLDWSQDELATNALVARATIADFERGTRKPMRSNLASIASALSAAGIEFIPDAADRKKGSGVRFRKVELEYSRNIQVNSDSIVLSVKYAGTPYRILIPEELIADVGGRLGPTAHPTLDQRIQIVQDHLPVFLCAAENEIVARGESDGETVLLVHESLPEGVL